MVNLTSFYLWLISPPMMNFMAKIQVSFHLNCFHLNCHSSSSHKFFISSSSLKKNNRVCVWTLYPHQFSHFSNLWRIILNHFHLSGWFNNFLRNWSTNISSNWGYFIFLQFYHWPPLLCQVCLLNLFFYWMCFNWILFCSIEFNDLVNFYLFQFLFYFIVIFPHWLTLQNWWNWWLETSFICWIDWHIFLNEISKLLFFAFYFLFKIVKISHQILQHLHLKIDFWSFYLMWRLLMPHKKYKNWMRLEKKKEMRRKRWWMRWLKS